MKKTLNIFFTAFAFTAALLTSCTPEPGPAEEEREVTSATDKDSYTVKGTVSCDGTPLSGVLVSDGRNVATTDLNGHYWLKSSADDDIIFLSIPAGYAVDVADNSWEPRFWYTLDQDKIADGQVQTFDFVLNKVENDDFRLMVMTDVHIRGRFESIGNQLIDSVIFINQVRPALKSWRQAADNVPTYGIVLGDMIQDAYVPRHNTGLPEYKALLRGLGYPVFHIPGNHEYESGSGFATAASDEEDREARAYYRRHLGPTYYSFNLGKVHFVMLDGTDLIAGSTSKYKNIISPRQLSWLRKDLLKTFSKNSRNVPEKLVVCCHQPFFLQKFRTKNTDGCISNRSEVLSIIADCMVKDVTILSGHIHHSDIANSISANSVKVEQYSHTAMCGPFWIQNYNWDDAPNGWTEYNFTGTSFTRRQHAYDPLYDKQVIIYKDDMNDMDGNDTLYINIPAYEKGWSVKVQKNQGGAQELPQVSMKAPRYTDFYMKNIAAFNGSHNITPRTVCHFFAYEMTDRDAEYTVLITAPDGTEYTDKVLYNN